MSNILSGIVQIHILDINRLILLFLVLCVSSISIVEPNQF